MRFKLSGSFICPREKSADLRSLSPLDVGSSARAVTSDGLGHSSEDEPSHLAVIKLQNAFRPIRIAQPGTAERGVTRQSLV